MRVLTSLATLAALLTLLLPCVAAEPKWDDAARYQLTLFQPGQSAWEWLLVPATHGSGARRMREGVDCRACHAGEEAVIGNRVVAGEVLEPDPLRGMPGSLEADVAMLRTGDNLHLRIAWDSLAVGERAGDAEHPVRVTVMLGSEALPTARIAGCWASCHVDSPGMPDAHPDGLTKYLSNSRQRMTASGGGTNMRSAAELADELAQGRFLEYWQAVLDHSEVVEASDGYFLEARHRNDTSAVSAMAKRKDGRWVVTLTRPLRPEGGPRKPLESGDRYTLAIAIHDNHIAGRHHYVSLPVPMIVDPPTVRLDLGQE